MPTRVTDKVEQIAGEKLTPRILLVAAGSDTLQTTRSLLEGHGYACLVASGKDEALCCLAEKAPEIVLINVDPDSLELSRQIKKEQPLPIIGLISKFEAGGFLYPDIDDVILEPFSADELLFRIQRLLARKSSGETIKAGDLVIDLARCEVSLNGRVIILAFKEYELLKFLVSNRGRVFNRETLLNRVWGYDYFGGDRTVDVHVRRLRSKIEDPNHTFIETIRNIGYRFRKDI